jgi:probable F420-dependent oxidoreductase
VTIQVGINPLLNNVGMAAEIEAMGFDSLWCSEHILFHGPVAEALTTIAYWSAQTSRITLGTAVYLMPLRHAAITAKSAGWVDRLSGGRLILGIGVGGEFAAEFEAVGVPVRERGARTDEAMAVAKRLWTEDSVTHDGRFFPMRDVRMEPKPARPGGPPIWVAGRSDAAIRRAATLGDGYLPYLFTPDRYARSVAQLREHAEAAGRADAVTPAHYLFYCLGDSKEGARAMAANQLSANYQQDFHPLVDRFCPTGTADDCLEFITKFVVGGARHVVLVPTCPPDEIAEQVRRAGSDLLPALRALA